METNEIEIREIATIAWLLLVGCEPLRKAYQDKRYSYVFDRAEALYWQKELATSEQLSPIRTYMKGLKMVQAEVSAARQQVAKTQNI